MKDIKPCKKCGGERIARPHYGSTGYLLSNTYVCLSCARIRLREIKRKHGGAAKFRNLDKAKFPEKYKARKMIETALRFDRIKRENCFCGSEKVQGHHEDYSKPLEVIWLCPKHHGERHRQMRAII